jgi:hypothetical protein
MLGDKVPMSPSRPWFLEIGRIRDSLVDPRWTTRRHNLVSPLFTILIQSILVDD